MGSSAWTPVDESASAWKPVNEPGKPPPKKDNFWQRMGLVPSEQQLNNIPIGKNEEAGPAFSGSPGELLNQGLQQGSKELGKYYVQQGPKQVGSGISDVAQGNIAQGGHKIISGGMTTLLPLMPEAIAANPIMAARAAAGGFVGNKVASGGAQALGANPEQAQFAGDLGNLAGGFAAGTGLPRAVLETPTKNLVRAHADTLMDLLSPKTFLKSKIKDFIATQAEKPEVSPVEGTAAGPVPAESGPSAKMIDVPNRSVQAGPNPPENLLPVPGKPVRGPQGVFEVRPPEGTGTDAGPIESEAAPAQAAPVVTPANTPTRRVTMGDPAKAGDYTVAPIQQGGKEIGKIVYQVDGDRGIIHWVGDPQMENSLSSQLGPMGLKQLFLKFAQANPEVKTLEGIRVGGANGDAALSKTYNVSDLYAKTPPRSLLSAHERQLAGQNSRPPVTYNPAPGGPTVAPAVTTEPRVPVDYNDMSDLLVQSLKMLREGKK